jgi:hypothetical protein
MAIHNQLLTLFRGMSLYRLTADDHERIRVPVMGQVTFAGGAGACRMFQYEGSGTDREKISRDTGSIAVDRRSGIGPDFRSDLVVAVEEDRRRSATLRAYRLRNEQRRPKAGGEQDQ